MSNPFSKGWKYLMASFDSKIDENADPKVQIQQASQAAKQQHQAITEQASSVIGNQKQLEMKLNRLIKSQEEHQQQARTAIQAADQAADAGDTVKAQEYGNTAEIFASQLVSVEQQIEETKQLHAQATQAAEQAKQQQKESELNLKEQLGQIDQLRAQVDQAAMQESTTQAMDTMGELKPEGNVPTLDAVRDKIERRYADALGAQELTQTSVQDRMTEITSAGSDMKASARLAEIRASMGQVEGDKDKALTEGAGDKAATGADEATVETESEGIVTAPGKNPEAKDGAVDESPKDPQDGSRESK